MSINNDTSADVVFEYTGKECRVPKSVTIVRFHPSVIEVENEAFKDCKQLREVIFNDCLQKIGDDAFFGCRSLSSINLPSTITEIDNMQRSTVTEIGFSAFWGCDNLSEVVFNNGLRKIGEMAFCYCRSLSSIILPSTVTEVGFQAFRYCGNLREVMFNGIPREIGKEAFLECGSLRFTFPTFSSRLDALIQTGHWEEIENEVDEVRGAVERSDGELFVSAQAIDEGRFWDAAMDRGRNWNRVRDILDKIARLISCYELKEGTSIFELALWKFKLDQVDKANPIPRKKCRMDVPGPVKDIILQYLPYECLQPVANA